MNQDTPTTFDNASDAMLADAIGDLDSQIKAIKARLDQAKTEFKRRRRVRAVGARFTVEISRTPRQTLDGKALRAKKGDRWCAPFMKTSAVTST